MDMDKTYSVDVLGTVYTVTFATQDKDRLLTDCDGYCDKTTKKIVVDKCEDGDLGDKMLYLRKNVRHELVHAYMYESGLAEDWEHKKYGQEETTVDWIAHMLPKINRALINAGLGECT